MNPLICRLSAISFRKIPELLSPNFTHDNANLSSSLEYGFAIHLGEQNDLTPLF